MHGFDVDGVRYRMHKFDLDGVVYYQFRSLFRLQEPDSRGVAYLVYLRRDKAMGGRALLRVAERIAATLGAKRMRLQDAAHIYCRGNRIEFDLGFRSMLSHGKTWYQLSGYRPAMGERTVEREAADVERAIRAYARLPVRPIVDAVESQVAAMRAAMRASMRASGDKASWEPVSRSLFFSGDVDEYKPAERKKASAVLRARVSLLKLLRTADADADKKLRLLGPWLLSLGCNDYSRFMRSMYGSRAGPGVAIEQAGGVRTPTLAEFERANWFRRVSHRLSWNFCLGVGCAATQTKRGASGGASGGGDRVPAGANIQPLSFTA